MVIDTADGVTKKAGDGNRKFRILDLSYPAHISHPKIAGLMLSAQSFHMWFEREQKKPADVKLGGLSLTFDTEKQAQHMYLEIKNLVIDGTALKIQAPKALASAAEAVAQQQTSSSANGGGGDPDIAKKLYICNLLPSSDYDLLLAIFGRENLKQVCVLEDQERKDGSKVAVLTFADVARAESARNEFNGFHVDDGQYSRPMRIIPFAQHLQSIGKAGSDKTISRVTRFSSGFQNVEDDDGTHPEEELYLGSAVMPFGVVKSGPPVGGGAGRKAANLWSAQIISNSPKSSRRSNWDTPPKSVDSARIKSEIAHMMQNSGTNWQNVTQPGDLWTVLEQVAAEIGHVPERDLMKAMLSSLEDAKRVAPKSSEWLHRHLTSLTNAWRREYRSQYPSEDAEDEVTKAEPAPEYTPVPEPKKKHKSKHQRKDVIGLMGVGALLAGMSGNAPEDGERGDSDNNEPEPPKKPISKRPSDPRKKEAKVTPQQRYSKAEQPSQAISSQSVQASKTATATPAGVAPSSGKKRKIAMDEPVGKESSSGSESSSEDSSSSSDDETEKVSKKKQSSGSKKKAGGSKKDKTTAAASAQQQMMMMANMMAPMMSMMQAGNRSGAPSAAAVSASPYGGAAGAAGMSPQAMMAAMQKMMQAQAGSGGMQQRPMFSPAAAGNNSLMSMCQQMQQGFGGGGANNPAAMMGHQPSRVFSTSGGMYATQLGGGNATGGQGPS